ncbi:MAG: hypothetical protein O4751_11655 [Trichodesmium sp. St2_bin6]|nr:hypothetical protein [Trichodesmium sp. MAG_R01]MDE5070292.1 hypothetical protein [Trichodesmium sp. St4_bin8_1]MDE5073366.1 hypothetical protein [Trichodesmium sp. St5_bin8]MDE5078883.1 hypothetical protein [Trichodesmium sp. St2_bin6]MDE5091596.1 hypothetical protein [Trichodesmium sp. St18_bin3_1_1]
MKPSDLIEVDRIIPKSEGGDNTYKNKHDTQTVLDSKIYQKPKLQDLPERCIWVNDMLILEE